MAQVWTVKANVTTARYSNGSAQLGNDVLSFGGAIGNPNPITAVNQLWSFTGNSWSSKANMIVARQFMASTSTTDDYAFSLGGGVTGVGTQETTETRRYSLTGNAWSTRASFSLKRDRCGAVALSSTSIVLIGGNGNPGGATAACELFDDSLNSWSATGSLNAATAQTQGCAIGSDALKVGGSTVEKYSTGAGTWATRTAMNVSSTRPGASEYEIGVSCLAYAGDDSYLTRTELYDDAGNTWTTVSSLNTGRKWIGSAGAGSQGALATGGFNGSVLNANELFESTGDFTRNTIYSDLPIEIEKGGTAAASHTAYGVLCGGTTSTAALQSIAVGSSGQVLKSGGSSALPSFVTASTDYMFQVLAADPSAPGIGQVWYNSVSDLYKGAQGVAGAWTAKTSMNTARHSLAGSGDGSDGLSFGGNTGSLVGTTERYSGSGNTWTAKTALNTVRESLGGAGSAEDGLSFGGSTGSVSAVTERYNGTGNTWTAKTAMSTARSALAGAGTADSALSFGGTTGTRSAVTEIYDGSGNSWATKTAMNTARSFLAGSGTSSDALSYGGNTGSSSGVTERYDLTGNSWTAKTSMSTARESLTGAGAATSALSISGWNASSNLATTEQYEGVGNSWSAVDNVNTARRALGGCGTSTDALCLGGYSTGISAATERYEVPINVVTFTVT